MDIKLFNASRIFINNCEFVNFAQNLGTKIRITLKGNYFMDMYYNETLGKYTYTLIKEGRRIVGWDNAPHHRELENFPHHFHTEDGRVVSSTLIGDPETDILTVVEMINEFLRD